MSCDQKKRRFWQVFISFERKRMQVEGFLVRFFGEKRCMWKGLIHDSETARKLT